MKSLVCLAVGSGKIVTARIESFLKVGDLINLLKEKHPSIVPCEAADVTLWVAKKKDGSGWLKSNDANKLVQRDDIMKIHQNKMHVAYRLSNAAFSFPEEDDADAEDGAIHVLVAVPDLEINNIVQVGSYEQPWKPIPDENLEVVQEYLAMLTEALGSSLCANERKHYILPVLTCVCTLFDGDARIWDQVTISGNRVHGQVTFDFVIERGSKRVCVVEAKRDHFRQGQARAYVGGETLMDVEGLTEVYCVVTNFVEWRFSRSVDGKLERDAAMMSSGNPGALKVVAGKIYAMLSEDEELLVSVAAVILVASAWLPLSISLTFECVCFLTKVASLCPGN
ncbi:Crinkler effector protein 5 [Phytophthora ramorum]|uniref:Crinkler effector protein 5 n=1 Tax=Phytophthora ramorum TaxID=164328 RepID=UPI00309D1CEA|nr:Crinkler effector protein 5 [Phytophthora ramorum]